jgi:hypothetical protein
MDFCLGPFNVVKCPHAIRAVLCTYSLRSPQLKLTTYQTGYHRINTFPRIDRPFTGFDFQLTEIASNPNNEIYLLYDIENPLLGYFNFLCHIVLFPGQITTLTGRKKKTPALNYIV